MKMKMVITKMGCMDGADGHGKDDEVGEGT